MKYSAAQQLAPSLPACQLARSSQPPHAGLVAPPPRCSVHWLADPNGAHKFHYAEGVAYDDTTARQYGWALASMAAMPLAISAAEGGKVSRATASSAVLCGVVRCAVLCS